MRLIPQLPSALILLALAFPPSISAQLVVFNDYARGGGTHPNATSFAPGASGFLRNITNGAATALTLSVTGSGLVFGPTQAQPDAETPASDIFEGYVDFAGNPNPAIEVSNSPNSVLTYSFSGLNTALEYNFQGSAIRGEPTYVDRWTIFEILGTTSFTSNHSTNALTSADLPGLTDAQVVINTGNNTDGAVAWWEHIRPGGGGTFSVSSRQYTGPIPGGSSGGIKGYAMTGIRLEEAPVYSGQNTNKPAPNPTTPNLAPNNINGIKTVFIILMENHDWSTILGSEFCPYINNTLLPVSSYANQYYNPPTLHPSEPNYIWLVAGTNFGIRNDALPSVNHKNSTNTIFHLLDLAGISWKTYQENITGTSCPDTNNYPYAARHNPFVFFDSVRNNLNYCTNHVRPYSELGRDLTNNTVARFNFLTPNLTNDMHDTAPGSPSSRLQGDTWLENEIPKILNSQAYAAGGLILITWDEGAGTSDGPIGLIALSPRAKGGGYHNNIHYTHGSTLRTLQNIFGVRPYLADATFQQSLDDLFKTPEITSFAWQPGGFRFTAHNLIPTKTNWVQVASSLDPPDWTTIHAAKSTSNLMNYTNLAPIPSQRFYRVVELP